jgi:hypothetical protein
MRIRRITKQTISDSMRVRKVMRQLPQPDYKRDGLELIAFTQRANAKLKSLGYDKNRLSKYRQSIWKEAWEEGISTPEEAAFNEYSYNMMKEAI